MNPRPSAPKADGIAAIQPPGSFCIHYYMDYTQDTFSGQFPLFMLFYVLYIAIIMKN